MSFKMRLIPVAIMVVLLVASCAKQGYPSGGPKDVTPPAVVAMNPPDRILNFTQKEFFIEFDEYVTVKDAENNILVSPPMKTKPEYTSKGHGIRVRLRDTLLPSSTYLFQFKSAIVDFTEGNPLPSLEYVFSTGDEIDSLSIMGSVHDAVTDEPRKEVLTVMAYSVTDNTVSDSLAMSEQPTYITRTNADGSFALNHIKPGHYHIVALEDVDKNMRLAATELMAFVDSLVPARLPTDSVPVAMRVSSTETQRQRITKSGFVAKGHIQIVTAAPMLAPKVEIDSAMWRLNAKRDTLNIWSYNELCDSARVVLSDTSGLADTLNLRFRERQSRRNMSQKQQQNKNFIHASKSGAFPYFDTLRLRFDTPVSRLHNADSAVTILNLSDSTKSVLGLTLRPDSLGATIGFVPQQGTSYDITVSPRTVADLYGHWNDTLNFKIQTSKAEDYGKIIVKFSADAPRFGTDFVVQLLDDKKNVVTEKRVAASETVTFNHLNPAKYGLRAIVDRNANGKWDAGDYLQRRQPEEVIYFEKQLELRANWDMEERFEL